MASSEGGTPIGPASLPADPWTCLMSRTAFLAIALLTATIVFAALKPTLIDSMAAISETFAQFPVPASR